MMLSKLIQGSPFTNSENLKEKGSDTIRTAEKFDYLICGFDLVIGILTAFYLVKKGNTVFLYNREDNGMPDDCYLLNTSRVVLMNHEIMKYIYKIFNLDAPKISDAVTLMRYLVYKLIQEYEDKLIFTKNLQLEPKLNIYNNKRHICDVAIANPICRPKHDNLSKIYAIQDRLIKYESVAKHEYISCKHIILTTPVYNFTKQIDNMCQIGIAKRALKPGIEFTYQSRIDDFADINELMKSGVL